MSEQKDAEAIVREIRRKTRKLYSAEEKIRIVLEGLPFAPTQIYRMVVTSSDCN